jgi:hypothetical protein
MNTLQPDKKQELLRVLDKIEKQHKHLTQTLESVYKSQTLETEKEFISSCNYLQMLAKQALNITGYYKSLSDVVPRAQYAPEELEGDASDISNLISFEMTRLEKQIEEGNKARPVEEPDVTKEQWLEAIEKQKVQYKKTYEELKKYCDGNPDNEFAINPKEPNIILDDFIISLAKGFMVGPVGLFRNKVVGAGTQVFDNKEEMHIFLNVQCKTQDMVLYMTFEQDGKYYWRGEFVYKA